MTAATHIAIGAGISTIVGNPVLGFGISFLSHFIVDIIPHGDSFLSDEMRKDGKMRKAVLYGTFDYLVTIPLFFLFLVTAPFISLAVFLTSCLGSIAPDLLVGLHDLTKSKYLKGFNDLHFWFHDLILNCYGDVRLSYSLFGQLAFIISIIVLV